TLGGRAFADQWSVQDVLGLERILNVLDLLETRIGPQPADIPGNLSIALPLGTRDPFDVWVIRVLGMETPEPGMARRVFPGVVHYRSASSASIARSHLRLLPHDSNDRFGYVGRVVLGVGLASGVSGANRGGWVA